MSTNLYDRCVEGPITRRVRLVTNEKGEWSSITDENSGEHMTLKELHFPGAISALALAVVYEMPLRLGPDRSAVTREEVWICLFGPKPVPPPVSDEKSGEHLGRKEIRFPEGGQLETVSYYRIPCPSCGVPVKVHADADRFQCLQCWSIYRLARIGQSRLCVLPD